MTAPSGACRVASSLRPPHTTAVVALASAAAITLASAVDAAAVTATVVALTSAAALALASAVDSAADTDTSYTATTATDTEL